MSPAALEKLAAVLAYVVDAEAAHYDESGRPEGHVYALAVDCLAELEKAPGTADE